MDTRFFRLLVLMSMCLAISTVQAAEDVELADKADAQVAGETTDVSMEDVLQQKIELDRQRTIQMRGPRDAYMEEVARIKALVEAREQTILAENETAAELKAEIAELDQALVEKSEALAAIFDTDEELLTLRTKQSGAQASFQKSQLKLRNEITQQHRARRRLLEQAREAAAEKAAEAEQAAETSEKE